MHSLTCMLKHEFERTFRDESSWAEVVRVDYLCRNRGLFTVAIAVLSHEPHTSQKDVDGWSSEAEVR